MIFIRLRHLAVILLVLLFVVSAMGGSNHRYKYYASVPDSGPVVCLSFKHRGNLTDCCNKDDHLQRFYVTKTGALTGIFHTRNLNKILCYDDKKGKFKIMRRRSFIKLDKLDVQCGRKANRIRHKAPRKSSRKSQICPFSEKDKGILENPRGNLRCVLHETLQSSGYTYISVDKRAKYLAVRGGRVQKHINKNRVRKEPKEKNRRFMAIDEESMARISNKPCVR